MLRVNRLVVISTEHGEIIIDHDYDCLYRADVLSAFLQCQANLDEMDYHITLKKDWQACHLRVNNVCFAVFINAVILSPADALYMVTFLKRFSELCKEFCGAVDSLTLERNLLLLMEIIGCTLINGYVQLMDPAKVKAYLTLEPQIHSPRIVYPQRDPKRATNVENANAHANTGIKAAPGATLSSSLHVSLVPSGDPAPRAATLQRPLEVFVDVIEKVSAILDVQGVPSFVSIDGEVKVKSLTSGPARLHIAFDRLPSAFESMTFGSNVSNGYVSNFIKTGACNLHLDNSEESNIAMTYKMNCLGVPPFVLHRGVINKHKPTDLTLKLENRLPPDVLCVNAKVVYKLPAGYSILNHTSDVSVTAGLLTWSLSKLRGGIPCETNVEMVATEGHEETKAEETELFVEPARMSFEMSNYLISGMVLRSVKLDAASARSTKKWIRTITVSQVYEQKL